MFDWIDEGNKMIIGSLAGLFYWSGVIIVLLIALCFMVLCGLLMFGVWNGRG